MAAVETSKGPRTYGNWRRPTSPGILGLGSVGTGLLLAGLVAIVITVMVADLLEAVIVTAVLGCVMLAVLTKDSHGKNVLSRGGARAAWWSAPIPAIPIGSASVAGGCSSAPASATTTSSTRSARWRASPVRWAGACRT